MPYYSVRITGGEKADKDARKVRETFRSKEADYGGTVNFFYVENHRRKDDLAGLISGMVSESTTVEVTEIEEDEYNWRNNP